MSANHVDAPRFAASDVLLHRRIAHDGVIIPLFAMSTDFFRTVPFPVFGASKIGNLLLRPRRSGLHEASDFSTSGNPELQR